MTLIVSASTLSLSSPEVNRIAFAIAILPYDREVYLVLGCQLEFCIGNIGTLWTIEC